MLIKTGLVILLQGLGNDWQEVAPEELRTKLGLAVRQLKGNWRLGTLLNPSVAYANNIAAAPHALYTLLLYQTPLDLR